MDRPAFDAPGNDWLVYADWLQQQGQPLGTVIALDHARDASRDAFVEENWTKILGDLPRESYAVDWQYGLVKSATIRITATSPDLLGPLAAHPLFGELRSIELRAMGTVDLAPYMSRVLEAFPHATSFAFIDDTAANSDMLVSRDFEPDQNLVQFGSFAPFWPRAEAMRIECADAAQLPLEPIVAAKLRSFVFRALRIAGFEEVEEVIAGWLNAAQFPALEEFEMRCTEEWTANVPAEVNPYVAIYSAPDYDGRDDTDEGDTETVDWAQLGPLFGTLAKCPLRRLALTSVHSMNTLIPALAEAGLAPTLRELDFTDAVLTSAGDLLENAGTFANLEAIVLDATPLPADELARLRTLGPKIVHSEGPGARYRYVVGQE